MSAKLRTSKAILRCAKRADTWVRMAPAALVSNDAKVMSFVVDNYTREYHSVELLKRRLDRNKVPVRRRILKFSIGYVAAFIGVIIGTSLFLVR